MGELYAPGTCCGRLGYTGRDVWYSVAQTQQVESADASCRLLKLTTAVKVSRHNASAKSTGVCLPDDEAA